MAVMIPTHIEDLEAAQKAHEDVIFEALRNIPDNNLYVFHSYHTMDLDDTGTLQEHEIDFIICHPELGMIVMESKASEAGDIYFDTEWKYGNGKPMNHNPFTQADHNKWNILNKPDTDKNYKFMVPILRACKTMHCVCFPTMTSAKCDALRAGDGYNRALLISSDDLSTPDKLWKKLKQIASIPLPCESKLRKLTDDEFNKLIYSFLCPEITGTVGIHNYVSQSQSYSFFRLLERQVQILEFLELEDLVAITGGAGTGKTVIAIEKARRLAYQGDDVIFLCFNRELKKRLEKGYKLDGVKFYTLSGLVMALTGSYSNFKSAADIIEEEFYSDNQGLQIGNTIYKHIIIDEAQDFGNTDNGDRVTSQEEISDREKILNNLSELIMDRKGCFYVFYDKQQLIQSKSKPKFIENIDIRLALRQNIRNTENIGKVAAKTISDKRCFIPNTVAGEPPVFHYINKNNVQFLIKRIDSCITKYNTKLLRDIVVLTTGSIESSSLYKAGCIVEEVEDGYYKNYYYKAQNGSKVMFTTCRRFKGCEAEVVLFVDVDSASFKKGLNAEDTQENFIYYVGTSRAKKNLEVFTTMSEDECKQLLPLIDERYKKRPSTDVYRDITTSLGGVLGEIKKD